MQNQKVPQKYILLTVFISGLVSLGIEMAASRLLGNVFGTSNLVWASIIGLILIYLTVGYYIGGKWADRRPEPSLFFRILTWSGISVAVIPLVSQPVLKLASNAFDELNLGILLGSFVSVMVLMLVPMILLGTASPFAIRLLLDETGRSGRVSGNIYAISTIGSFIGTFLASLVLTPLVGTYRTYMIFALLLLLVSVTGLLLYTGEKNKWLYLLPVVVVIILVFIGKTAAIKATPGQVYETESEYNYIQVVDYEGYTLLRLNEGQGIHSIYKADVDNFYGPWEQFLVGPFFNASPFKIGDVKSIAIVGLAAGTTARAATKTYGDIQIDGFEIDPRIIEVGQKYFDMNQPNLNPVAVDGRWGLENSDRKYSIIAIDAYRPPYIPPHLTTREFFQVAYSHLLEDGVVVINAGRSPADRRLINDLSVTLGSVFPSVYVMDIPDSFNTMIFATLQPTSKQNLLNNLVALSADETTPDLLLQTLQVTAAYLKDTPTSGRVYTDDLAPIEWVTNSMVMSFLLTDSTGILK